MRLPKSLRIGWRHYKIERWKPQTANSAQRFGECDKNQAIIRVDNSYGNDKTCHTLLHEIIHALWCDRDLNNDSNEEAVVTGLTNGLVAFVRDNPRAAREWLNQIAGLP